MVGPVVGSVVGIAGDCEYTLLSPYSGRAQKSGPFGHRISAERLRNEAGRAFLNGHYDVYIFVLYLIN
jgi:hypothetical protein